MKRYLLLPLVALGLVAWTPSQAKAGVHVTFGFGVPTYGYYGYYGPNYGYYPSYSYYYNPYWYHRHHYYDRHRYWHRR